MRHGIAHEAQASRGVPGRRQGGLESLRIEHSVLHALHEEDGETPKLYAPYPIRDSNRLIEEVMLLANYLVAQRLITHASGRALLRNHNPPIEQGMQ